MVSYKKSQGHVEMILSFSLFIVAVLFIFFYLNPIGKFEKTDHLDKVKNAILKNISTKMMKLSVVSYDGSGCYDFKDSEYPGNYIEVSEVPNKKLYVVYFSDKFLVNNAPHKDQFCPSGSYKLGIYSDEDVFLYDSLIEIVKNADSVELKKSLGIDSDFLINVTDQDGNVLSELSFEKRIPFSVKVESRDFPLRLVKRDGNFVDVFFGLKVW